MQINNVWVTRPDTVADSLIHALNAEHMRVLYFPLTEIVFLSNKDTEHAIQALDHFMWHLFVSRNAVKAVLPQIKATWSMIDLKDLHFAAVGKGTAEALLAYIDKEITYPEKALGAEALWQVLQNKILPNQRVMIWCGDKSMQILPEILRAKGHEVKEVVCYRQEPLILEISAVIDALTKGEISHILIHSGESLMQLMKRIPLALINACTLIVVSQRLQELAKSKGFLGKIRVADGADDASMIQAIKGK